MRVCICGGGNLGHVAAGFMAARKDFEVTVLTRHPERWDQRLSIECPDGATLLGRLSLVTSNPEEAVAGADVVLLCLPGNSIRSVLLQIKDFLPAAPVRETAVGTVVSSTGFWNEALAILPADVPLFGLQRVPFIARTAEYGHKARLLGFKKSLQVAVEHTTRKEELRVAVERMFDTPTVLLDNYYEACLSNSNPLLHPARLFDLWHDWHREDVYARVNLFYEEWTDEAAQLYIDMDSELQRLLTVLPVRKGCIPNVLDYYESTDAASLARKLRSIEAFKGIEAPMRQVAGGFVPDFQSRYFTEDFPYGLALIQRMARTHGIATPTIDRVCQWGMELLNF